MCFYLISGISSMMSLFRTQITANLSIMGLISVDWVESGLKLYFELAFINYEGVVGLIDSDFRNCET